MVFTSHIFIFYFLPAVLLIYYILPRHRNIFLLFASYVFYGWWKPWFVFLMLFSTVANYACGLKITNAGDNERLRYRWMVISVIVSLGTLGFFKYFMFLQHNLNFLISFFETPALPVLEITLPIGISFYIFQSLSYTIDVYRRESPPVRSFFDFACFVALFPQLIAGPIVRYNTIADQLVTRTHTREKFASGIALFILGFAKKLLLANPAGEAADAVFNAQASSAADAWFGVVMYAFQIYFDFSGYSDMAIGLGRMVGFEFPRNFSAPYRSANITEFWRRWHISLSTFLRDYLYIPLGGNRKGPGRTYVNLALVMLLGGLWHGASWTFVIWGAYHGLLLAFERWLGKKSVYDRLPLYVRRAITFVLVLFSWVLFRAADFTVASNYFKAMFGFGGAEGGSALLAGILYTQGNFLILAVCTFFAFHKLQAFDWVEKLTIQKIVILLILFYLSLAAMFVQAFNPFLYYQF